MGQADVQATVAAAWERLQAHKVGRSWQVDVAVSGGPDSMALLHALSGVCSRLRVLHVDHGIRSESDSERRMVERVCQEWDVPATIVRVDVPGYAQAHKLSLETAARNCRYQVFNTHSFPHTAIALAHHADDQVETVLMHLLRGAGAQGLQGMGEWEPPLWRPLLGLTKADLLAYCVQHDIPYAVDASNNDTHFARNAMRHELLPLLETINPQVRQALLRNARLVRWDCQALDDQALAWMRDGFVCKERNARLVHTQVTQLPAAVETRVWRQAWGLALAYEKNIQRNSAPIDLEETHVEALMALARRKEAGAQLSLPHGMAWKGYGWVLLTKENRQTHMSEERVCNGDGTRQWQPGDKITLPSGTKKVSDVLTDAKVQPWDKAMARVMVVNGRVVRMRAMVAGRVREWHGVYI